MLKNTGIAAILALAFTAACTGGTGNQSQGLSTGDFDENAERCYHVASDYVGSDLVPPPISISIGDHLVNADEAMVVAQTGDDEGYSRLLAEFVTAQVSIDDGAEIDGDDIDALIQAEDMLVHLDAYQDSDGLIMPETADLIAALAALNEGFRIEVPCMDASNVGVFETAAPATAPEEPTQPGYINPKWRGFVVGANADETAPAAENEFYRPQS